MAVGNRTETKSVVTSALVPTLELSDHITLLNDSINESVVFRKDVIASETPGGGVVTIDYSDKDTATVTTAVNLAVSFTGIENGDVKYLEITKGLTDEISFVGANDYVRFKDLINSTLTLVLYRIVNKNNVIYVENIYSPTSNLFVESTLDSDWTGTFKYRVDPFSGKVQVEADVTMAVSGLFITTLPVAVRPDRVLHFVISTSSSVGIVIAGQIATSGVVAVNVGDLSVSDNIKAYFEYFITLPE